MTKVPLSDSPSNGRFEGPHEPQHGIKHAILDSAVRSDTLEPIAIIGLDLEFPQDAVSADTFWRLLIEGRSALTDIPKDRFNLEAFYHPDVRRANALNIRGGHFVRDDIAAFDAPFFSISPTEAACMDPQQRGLLECAYKALENAGVSLTDVANSQTSVHVGSFSREYETVLLRDPEMQAKYMATGTGTAMLANRLSWFFNLVGPSVTIDTACSSSLLALHLACQSLRSGESTMGLVAGCNLMYNPDLIIPMTNLNFLSADSKCYSFDHRANGYSRGEGFGVVVVKALSKALRDGNTIRAVIRATGTNQDGRTPGITQPSSFAQERLIRETYKAGGLKFGTTRFFEAHGTGTPVGDPLEASAIGAVFGSQRSKEDPLYVGALKSNIGHLEGASGIAGLIKSILVLERGTIPPNIWFERPNPNILSHDWNIKFPVQPTPWPSSGLRRASVNSFGFGGSNVHVVLDDAYHYLAHRNLVGNHHTVERPPEFADSRQQREDRQHPLQLNGTPTTQIDTSPAPSTPRLLVWSASDKDGLDRLASLYRRYLAERSQAILEGDSTYFEDLVYTICTKRSSLPWKSFAVVDSSMSLRRCLEGTISRPTRSSHVPRLAFVFTGQGAQWCGMGKELLIYPVFLESLQNAAAFFQCLGCKWDLIDEITQDQVASRMDDPSLSQPLCTALQTALIDLLRSWRIYPSTVAGHSSGEIAAAYCTGSLSQESAWKIAYYRGMVSAKAVAQAPTPGAMLSVGLSKANVLPYLAGFSTEGRTSSVTVGCVNSPDNVTLTGVEEQIDIIKMTLERHNVFVRKLKVGVAYHSIQLKEVAPEYAKLLGRIAPGCSLQGTLPSSMISTVTGGLICTERLRESEYWVRNLTSPVHFLDAISSMLSQSSGKLGNRPDDIQNQVAVIDHLVEIGPHSTLQGPVKSILKSIGLHETIGYSPLLRRGVCAIETSLTTAGRLHCLGYKIDFMEINRLRGHRVPRMLIDTPGYPFDHSQKYWLESRISKNYRFRHNASHELLGTTVRDWNPLQPTWRHLIRESESSWINDHKVNGTVLYPASGMLIMAIEAVRQLKDPQTPIKGYKLKNVEFLRALEIGEEQNGTETSFTLRPCTHNEKDFVWHEFCLHSYTCNMWVENCRGLIGADYHSQDEVDGGREERESLLSLKKSYAKARGRCNTPVITRDLYEKLSACGYGFGPCFQTLTEVYCSDYGEATSLIKSQDWTKKIPSDYVTDHVIHPTALDGVFQSIFAGLSKGGKNSIPTLVPTEIHELWLSHVLLRQERNRGIKIFSTSEFSGIRLAKSAIIALDDVDDEALVCISGLQTKAVAENPLPSSNEVGLKRICFNLDYQPDLRLLSNDQVFEYCSSISESVTLDRDEEIEKVELACFLSIFNTLQTVTHSMLPKSKPHLANYLAWMENRMEKYRGGCLLHGRSEWKSLALDVARQESLFERVERSNPEGILCVAVARNLSLVLTGKVDALGLLFDGALMDEYYHWSLKHGNSFAKIAAYLDALAHTNPNLNILEIGAGTGSGTESVIDILTRHGEDEKGAARYRHFTFTDISPSFFEKARERFASQANRMTYKVLDISLDPVKQGFEQGSYDLIVAVNVLHATPNLDTTLQNTRKLMKPGAKIVLFEICNPSVLRAGFIFGLLPGWWLGTENNRKWGPLLSESEWHDVLIRTGFSGTDVILRDNQSERTHLGSAIISTALEQANDGRRCHSQDLLILAAGESTLQRTAADQIRSQLLSLGLARCDVIDPEGISHTVIRKRCCLSLLELEGPLLSRLEVDQFANVQKVITSAKDLLWITKGTNDSTKEAELALVSGFSRCIRSEHNDLNFVTLALENTVRDVSDLVHHIVKVLNITFFSDGILAEKEYAEIGGVICINRIVEANYLNHGLFTRTLCPKAEAQAFNAEPTRPLTLSIASPGLLNTLQFVTDHDYQRLLEPEAVELEVKATGLNFLDVAVLLDQVSSDDVGLECAGIVTRVGRDVVGKLKAGDRVCCITRGSYKTYARSKAALSAKIPDSMSFVSAAATPMAYCTAYHSLYELGKIRKDTSLLIHSGAGGVGQAAIQLAKLTTTISNIFVTVGSTIKKKLLVDHYGILEDHIFSSRILTFVNGIKRMTQGRGVDLVINSLGGEKLRRSLDCVAPFGYFIDIGLKDVKSFGTLPVLPFSKSITFSSVDLDLMIRDAPDILGGTLCKVMELLSSQNIVPEASHIYSYSKLEDAFRLLQNGNNLGKIVAVPHGTDLVPVVQSVEATYNLNPSSTYLISGGLGGLGRSITRWMAARGARNLILLGRSGACNEQSRLLLDELRDKGVNVRAPACDISDENSLANALMECKGSMPPIRGCIQAAMVLKDGIFENMQLEDFRVVLKPKVQGSWNLHAQLPKGMDFFIFLSSVNGILGSRSQSNYGAGNTYEDALAKYRIKNGEKAVSLDLGLVNSVGFVAERQGAVNSQLLSGLSGIEESHLHAVLNYHCNPALPLLSPLKSQVIVGIETPAALKKNGIDEPYWLDQPICRHLFQMDDDTSSAASNIDPQTDYKNLLRSAPSLPAATDVVCNGLKEKLSKVLSIPIADIDGYNSISSHGTDSLVAVELRSWLSKEMAVDVAIFDILSNVSLDSFSEMVTRKSGLASLDDVNNELKG